VRGRAGLEEFTDNAIEDSTLLKLAARIRYQLDPTIDYPRHFSGHVKVIMADGKVFEENQPHPRGGLEDPLPPAEVEEKFRANARLALPVERGEKILDMVKHLEELPSIAPLSELLHRV